MTDATTTVVPDGLTLCTNWYGKTAHYAETAALEPNDRGGRSGSPLCSGAGSPGDVYDQEFEDNAWDRGRKPRRIEDLPLCKRCVRAAERQ